MKSKNTNAVALDKAWAEVAERNKTQTQPEGSLSRAQYAERYGVTVKQATGILERECHLGAMVSEMIAVIAQGGERRRVRFYSLVKPNDRFKNR